MLCCWASSSHFKGLYSHWDCVTLMMKALHCFKPLRSTQPKTPVSHPRRSYSEEIHSIWSKRKRQFQLLDERLRLTSNCQTHLCSCVPPPTFSSQDWKRSFPKLVFFSGITADDLQVLKASNHWMKPVMFQIIRDVMPCCSVTDSSKDQCVHLEAKVVQEERPLSLTVQSSSSSKYQQSLTHHVKVDVRHMQHLCEGLGSHTWLVVLVILYTQTQKWAPKLLVCFDIHRKFYMP
jgi:hypothetical protein